MSQAARRSRARGRRGRVRPVRRSPRRSGPRRRARSGTDDAQSPAWTVPIDNGWASVHRAAIGCDAALPARFELERAPRHTGQNFSIELTPSVRRDAWVACPARRDGTSAHRRWPARGRGRSARGSRRRRPPAAVERAKVPRPPSSSPCTAATSTSPRSCTPDRRIASDRPHARRPARPSCRSCRVRTAVRRRPRARTGSVDHCIGVAGRHDVDVAVEHQRRHVAAARSPPGEPADEPPRLGAIDLDAGEVGTGRDLVERRSASGRRRARGRRRCGRPPRSPRSRRRCR